MTATFGQQPPDSTENLRFEWSDSVSVGVIDKGWKFEVELYKPRTAWCEPIYMRKAITNLSGPPKRMPLTDFAFPDLGFEIRNSSGERMSLMRAQINFLEGGDTTLMLAPGDSSIIELDLLWHAPGQGPSMGFPAYRPGEYTVDISLYLDPMMRAPRAENTLVLPQLKFSIVEPTGDSAEALRLLAKGADLQGQQPQVAEACFDSVLTFYSNTPYDELANILLIHYRSIGSGIDEGEFVRWSERLFLEYVGSPFGLTNVQSLIPRIAPARMKELVKMIQDKPEAAKMLWHLRGQHPWIFEDDQ
ncbi:hypothetical protein ACFLQW_04790 [Candidatus Zixiibacteriota bacterium]